MIKLNNAIIVWGFLHYTLNSLLAYGQYIFSKINEYYTKLFITEGGYCLHVIDIMEVLQIFNTLFLKDITNA